MSILAASDGAQVIRIQCRVKASELSKDDLKDVLPGTATTLRRKQGGSRSDKSGPANEAFLKVRRQADIAYREGWRSMVFSARPACPKVDDDAAAVAFVAPYPAPFGATSTRQPPTRASRVLRSH